MKKLFLLAIMALCMNVYAQNEHKYLQPQHTQHSISPVLDMMKGEGETLPQFFEKGKSGRTDNHGLNELFTLIRQYDSLYIWTLDTSLNDWAFGAKYIDFFYDAHNNLTNFTHLIWNGSGWENDYQYVYTYDTNNNQTSFLFKFWDGAAWRSNTINIYTYDENNNLTSNTRLIWNGIDWVNLDIFIYTYDGNNNLLNELVQDWNGSGWENIYQYAYTYDANNNQTSKIEQFWNETSWNNSYHLQLTFDANNNWISLVYSNWNGTDWQDVNQDTATYDANHNLISDTYQNWDGTAWVNIVRYTYTYDSNNNVLNRLNQHWKGSAWENVDQDEITYDANNNEISETFRRWNGSAWRNSFFILNTYDQDNFLESKSRKHFDIDGETLIGGDSTHYYFHSVVATHDLLPATGSISIYPNPGSGKFTIDSKTEIISLEICNLMGERIFSDHNISLQKQKEIDLTAFGQGIYFAWISDGKLMFTRKVVIQ